LRKQIRLPYHSSESVSQCPFDLVHSDVWDPVPFVSKGGHKYYIIFIDDFSHHTWFYFMKHHSGALSIYKNFSSMIRTHFDTSIVSFTQILQESISLMLFARCLLSRVL
jgi:hypothetical protein